MLALTMPAAWGCSGSAATGASDTSGGFRDAGYDAIDAVYQPPPFWSGGAATEVATGSVAVSLGVAGARVFWQSAGGSVYACPLDGCADDKPLLVSSLIGASSTTLQSLGASASIVVFATGGGDALSSLDAANLGAPKSVYEEPASTFGPLVTDAANVYFVDTASTDAGDGQTISLKACPLTGDCASPEVLYSTSSSSVGAIAVAGAELFFVHYGDQVSIRAVPTTGGGPERTVCTSELLGGVQGFTVAAGYAYFTTVQDDKSIYQCATAATGGGASLYLEDFLPYALASDGENLYWTNYEPVNGTVAMCALGSACAQPYTVAANQAAPFAITAGASSVYWTAGTSIYRADK